jgi:uncharacterized protein YkwD
LAGAAHAGVSGSGASPEMRSASGGSAEPRSGGASERAVLTRYFAEPRPVVTEAEAPPAPERPIYARPRVWWDDQVRWSAEADLARRRTRPPPPPAPSPRPGAGAPTPPPPPARPSPAPIRIVTAPPSTPAEWAARSGASTEVLEAAEPTATRAARKLTRLWLAILAVVLMFTVIGLVALTPTQVPDSDSDPFRVERRSSGGAPGNAVQPGADGEDERENAGSGNADATTDVPEETAVPPASADPEPRLVARINEARARAGQGALVVDEDLSTVASRHVADMVDSGDLEHTPTDLLGRRVTNWEVLAESIGVGPSVSSLFDALMSSEADRHNLLDPAFRHVGVGATRADNRLWVTVLFSDSSDPGTTLD